MTAPTAPTLTERYIEATLRRLPERQRADIERELRASIADAIDARVEAGEDPPEAERAVLTGLGDPDRLAAGYADQPLHLIGPALFLPYIRLLTALLAIVVPIVATVVGIVRAVDGGNVGEVIGDVIGAVINTGVNVAFWTTLVFAILERLPSAREHLVRAWTPDRLPEPPSRRGRYAGLIAETVAMVLFVAFLLISPALPFRTDSAGDPISFLSPWLWDTGVVYLYVVLAVAGLAFNYVKMYVRWSAPVAAAGALVHLASTAVVVWAASTNRLLNPEFVAAAGWPADVWEWVRVGVLISAVVTVVMVAVELVRGFATRSWERADFGAAVTEATQRIPGVK